MAANDNYNAKTAAQEDLEARVMVALESMTLADVRHLVGAIEAKLRFERPPCSLTKDSLG